MVFGRVGIVCLVLMVAAVRCAGEGMEVAVERLTEEALAAGDIREAEGKLLEAEKLVSGAGEKNSSAAFLRALVLQSRGRVYATAWRQSSSEAYREKAEAVFRKVMGEYQTLQELCQKQAELLERTTRSVSPETDSPAYQEAAARVSQAEYGLAWSGYYLGLVAEDAGSRETYLEQSLEKFMAFTARGYRNHPIVANSFLGQGLVLYEQKQYYAVLELLDLKQITAETAPAGVYGRMILLRVKSCAALPSDVQAVNTAEQYFAGLKPDAALGAVEMEILLEEVRSLKNLISGAAQNPYAARHRELFEKGIERIQRQGAPWTIRLGQILGEEGELARLDEAKKIFQGGDYTGALEKVREARASKKDSADYFQSDWLALEILSHWNLKHFSEVWQGGQEFLSKFAADPRRGQIYEYTVEAGFRILEAGGGSEEATKGMQRILGELLKNSPDVQDSDTQAWYEGRLKLAGGEYGKAGEVFGTIPRESKRYGDGLYGQGLAMYQAMRAGKLPGSCTAEGMERLLGKIAELMEYGGGQTAGEESERVMKNGRQLAAGAGRLALDAIRAGAEREFLAKQALRAAEMAERKGSTEVDPAVSGIRIEARIQQGEYEKAMEEIDRALREPEGQVQVGVFLMAGDALERRYETIQGDADGAGAKGLAQRLVQMYEYVLKHGGEGPGGLAAGQRCEIRRRMAENLARTGRRDQAIAEYEALRKETSESESGAILRELALLYEEADRWQDAVSVWQILAKGLEKHTEVWYEANYHWISGFYRMGERAYAEKLMEYFRLRYPEIRSAAWRERFDRLAGQILGPEQETRSRQEVPR